MTGVIKGKYEPWVSTGRGSWVAFSETSLEKLLFNFDKAYPDFTDTSREELIANWKAAEAMAGVQ